MKLIIVLCALLAVGCGHNLIAVDAAFTHDEVDTIIEAADHWHRACDCEEARFFFDINGLRKKGEFLTPSEWGDGKSYGRVWKLSRESDVYKNEVDYIESVDGWRPNIAGLQSYDRIALVVEGREGDTAYLRGIAIHEFGHYLGLEHSQALPMGGKPQCVNDLMRTAVCLEVECGPKSRSTCLETWEVE